MKNKCEEKFTHLFYLYESWCGSSDGQTGRTFADKFYTGMVSHLNGQRRSSRGPNHVGQSKAHESCFPAARGARHLQPRLQYLPRPQISPVPQAQQEPPDSTQ